MSPVGSPHVTIGDYAIIGDCRSAALISREGSIDWLCWPRFDSPSLFAAILDTQKGGCFAVRPTGRFASERKYVGNTNVLETTFRTSTGVARLLDLMPVASEAEKRCELWPQHQILRRIECVEGEVELEIICDPRPEYARIVPRLRRRGALGIYYEHDGSVLILRSDIPLDLVKDASEACARVTLHAGERRYVSLVFSDAEPAIIPSLGADAERKIETSLRWWEQWASRCTYDGPYRAAVLRSALTLKLMAYAPSGAVVAAPTTSLPEQLGGVRNWDYRYCWLRDTSLTLQALFDLGYLTEAESFLSWLLIATRLTWPELRVLYDVYGRTHVPERELEYLAGFDDSRPVRIGNDARGQLQLDIYGEVIDSVYQFVRRGGRLDHVISRRLVELGDTVCSSWREPDEGIWEGRAGRMQHTYSKAMCWVALDRLIKMHDEQHIAVPVERFAATRREIEQAIEQRGFNEAMGSYVSIFDGDDVDASLLQLARHCYIDPCSPRMRGTYNAIEKRLGKNGLLYRYLGRLDGLPPGEGAFGICSFWAVSVRALQGDVDGAAQMFERVLSFANDVGLFAEEIDPNSGEALGNFPQAFTHVGLIDAALTLASAERGTTREQEAEVTQPAAGSTQGDSRVS
ncbi:MAG TPA: glycoside hydrolase family 15 protein [Gemmatimonadaceae bacterium]|nr:glycoside hydrolase family 15 protein [Gemmatimonadaceae bacterium]